MRKILWSVAAVVLLLIVSFTFLTVRQPENIQPDFDRDHHYVLPDRDPLRPLDSLRDPVLVGGHADFRGIEVMAELSSAIYSGEEDFRSTAERFGLDGDSLVWSTSGDFCAALVFSGEADQKAAIVVFRGTGTIGEVLADIDALSFPLDDYYVHKGFMGATNAVSSKLNRTLRESSPVRVWVTGHSLGGAMAANFVTRRLLEDEAKIGRETLITFGQPAFADRNLAMLLNERIGDNFVRLIYEDDLVAKLAPGFTHCGRIVRFRGAQISLKSNAPQHGENEDVLAESEPEATPDLVYVEVDESEPRIVETMSRSEAARVRGEMINEIPQGTSGGATPNLSVSGEVFSSQGPRYIVEPSQGFDHAMANYLAATRYQLGEQRRKMAR